VDGAQVPGCVAHLDAGEMPVAIGHLEAAALDASDPSSRG
jgi:hypothetical protein